MKEPIKIGVELAKLREDDPSRAGRRSKKRRFKLITPHPNSTAAKKWGRSSFRRFTEN